MKIKEYAIIGGIVLVIMIVVSKLMKFEGTSTLVEGKPSAVSLKPVLSISKEA
jgi:hypothetical protein